MKATTFILPILTDVYLLKVSFIIKKVFQSRDAFHYSISYCRNNFYYHNNSVSEKYFATEKFTIIEILVTMEILTGPSALYKRLQSSAQGWCNSNEASRMFPTYVLLA